MLIEIIKRTPPWVFFLFFILIAMGVRQTKERTIKEFQIVVLPTIMILLSLYGTFSAFGFWNIIAFTFWLMGLATAAVFCLIIQAPKGVTYSSAQKTYNLPGSWWPLSLMMTIFSIKYAVGVISARKLPVLDDQIFISLISLSYGLLSGIFILRAYIIWRYKNKRIIITG